MQTYNPATNSLKRYGWAGDQMILEVDGSTGQTAQRYVPGPGGDDPVVWYESAGATDRRFLHADERGSIVAVTNSAGSLLGVNRYDEYGKCRGASMTSVRRRVILLGSGLLFVIAV